MQDTSRGPVSILLVSDPGLPTRRARAVRNDLQGLLDATFREPVRLLLHTSMLRLRPDDSLDLGDAVALAEQYEEPDVVLLLTEIPRLIDGHPLIAEIFPDERVAVVSCPTLGAFRSRPRILDALVDCARRMHPPPEPRPGVRVGTRWSHWTEAEGEDGHAMLLARPWLAGPRTVLGMIAGNEPIRTAPRLSSAMAAAAATGAFGIFYSSIWAMSTYLSTPRLLGIGALAIMAMVTWLIVSNGLWDRPRRSNLARVVLLYSLSTVGTLLLCVLALYAALVALILAGGTIVIAPDYMATVIGDAPSWSTYLDIAWLSAAMGVVAGGLGSSFDSGTDLRSLTHGQRERQRRYTEEDGDRAAESRGAVADDAGS